MYTTVAESASIYVKHFFIHCLRRFHRGRHRQRQRHRRRRLFRHDARLVVGSVPTEMPSSVTSRRRCVFTRAYGPQCGGAIDPMLRVVIEKPLSPAMCPTCRPHKTLPNCRTAAPSPPPSVSFLLSFAFRSRILRPHTHARDILSATALSRTRSALHHGV